MITATFDQLVSEAIARQVESFLSAQTSAYNLFMKEQQQERDYFIEQTKIATPFNLFMVLTLTETFGKETSHEIVSLLDECRQMGDYHYFVGAYQLIDRNNVEHRQLLLTASKVYRYKFGSGSNQNSLKSEIKYATMCPHCGSLASKMVDRLKAEGLW